MTLLAGLLSLVIVQPAKADHFAQTLQVIQEIETGAAAGAGVTLEAQVTGAPLLNVRIAFELEGVPGDSDGANYGTADLTCTTDALGKCSKTITSATSGTGLVRAWIDADKTEQSAGGVREADVAEARLSNANPYVPGTESGEMADCRNNGLSDTEDTPYDECAPEGPLSTVGAGDKHEPDDTDVVQVGFSDAPTKVDCADSNALNGTDTEMNFLRENETYTCTVRDTGGNLVSGAPVDAENLAGANDTDNSAASGAPDYDTTDVDPPGSDATFCRTGSSGTCSGVISGAEAEAGPAKICFWVDAGSNSATEMKGDKTFTATASGADFEDGQGCAAESAAATEDDDGTDVTSITWSDAARAANALDVNPEPASATVGSVASLTATIYDQYGDKFTGSTLVRAELFASSPGDSDGNGFASPDTSCTTVASNTCNLQFTASSNGAARVCAYLGTPPATFSGSNVDGTCDGEGVDDKGTTLNDQDVSLIVWSGAATTTTTTQTTPPAEDVAKTQGYTLVGADGGIYNFGTSQFHGSTGDMKLNQPVIGLANKKGGTGYWLVAKDGGIFTFGDAEFFGSTGDMKLNAPILGMEATPTGKGYWLFGADGGIFTFGDANFFGSTGDMKLNAPAVGLAVNEKGDGYWLVAQDGGIFSFGNVPFHGSTGDKKLNQPVFDMSPTAGDKGYWLVAKDGGVFSFGDAEQKFSGSAVGVASGVVIGMGTTPTSNGYWIADSAGGVYPFGDARALGDRKGQTNNAPMVGFATVPKK